MIREDQSIGNHHIFSSASCEDYYFGNVIGRKGFASTIAKSQNSETSNGWPGKGRLTCIRRLLSICRHKTGRWRIPSIT